MVLPVRFMREGPHMAVSRSPAIAYEHLLWRKPTLGVRFSEAENDPYIDTHIIS